ncbi:haloalkane dehalogenase [Ruegeria sp. Ofav3-42]|uniref:haloalkane dehalogenase n=1 Tax=Ruegeria sp. Ofav3-42 TaxID=2917759 RepID=UPI001EF5B9E8|nr:haloalkane dehalogenase [Ruegeria sp. Ofav3-42]MCG7519481.1 haloalkane dehalogenase [Ruegeria sp. Ofav3-42]
MPLRRTAGSFLKGMTMEFLRTPVARFQGLPDFPFEPVYTQIDDTEGGQLRVHHVDEGAKNANPILMMHGEPSWSYLYRHMIAGFVSRGHRAVAPDLIGFGCSDKPTGRSDYTYERHVTWMGEWLRKVDLRNITLICQDWGGLIGLRLWAEMPDRFARIVVANTALPTGDQPMGEAFENWRKFSQDVPEFPAGGILKGGTVLSLSEDVIAAYDAPFPDESYKAGARQFPMLVPTSPNDPSSGPNRQAWDVIRELQTPVLTAFGADDKVMAGIDKVFQKLCPGAAGQPHVILPDAGHFLQEDVGPELVDLACDFIARTS